MRPLVHAMSMERRARPETERSTETAAKRPRHVTEEQCRLRTRAEPLRPEPRHAGHEPTDPRGDADRERARSSGNCARSKEGASQLSGENRNVSGGARDAAAPGRWVAPRGIPLTDSEWVWRLKQKHVGVGGSRADVTRR